jgi:hypothetical protein
MFNLSETINNYNVPVWGLENPHKTRKHTRDSPKVNVICALSMNKVYGALVFAEQPITCTAYLDMMNCG